LLPNEKIVFLGTAPFALPSLKLLLDNGLNLVGVITRPDRPAGRGKKISSPPVKEMALQYGQQLFQPQSKDELENVLLDLKPEILVAVAYGMILPPAVLAIPPLGAINLHPSLLPSYRGAAPIQRALLAGEESTGVSIFYMSSRMDAGDIILQERVIIETEETFGMLYDRLAVLGAEKLLEALKLIGRGDVPRIPQEDEKATFAPPLSREDEVIDWSKGAFSLANQVRALDPFPGAYTYYRGKRLKIWKAVPEKQIEGVSASLRSTGTICRVEKDFFNVSTDTSSLKILELQPEGKKRMKSGDFLKGYSLQVGEKFA